MAINAPGDKYELEADRVADHVLRVPEIAKVAQAHEIAGHTPRSAPGLEVPVSAAQSGGQPLPESVRAFFEPRFGFDFRRVRVHTGAQAAESARTIHALAYTVGNDIVFGAGQYAPESTTGRRLLAHELAHTVQQHKDAAARQIQRTISVDDPTATTPPHTQNNGALTVSLFNQLCPGITWRLSGTSIEPTNASDCDAAAVQRGTTPTACDCACSFIPAAGPHVNIQINQTDDNTVSTGSNSFQIRLTGQAASGMRGIRGTAPASGSPLQSVPDPAWLILGHELCGHAKTTYPLNQSSTADFFHQMSQNWSETAVDIENRIRQEHNASQGANLGIRIGEWQDIEGDIHAGSLIRLPRAMSLGALLPELGVPVDFKRLRCVRQDFFYPCATIPSTEAAMLQERIIDRVQITHDGNQAVPWSCLNHSFSQGVHFNIEGVFWHRSVGGETKQTIAAQWGVSITAMDRANRLFGNGVDAIPDAQALSAGTMVVIPYKSAPGSTRYFLTRTNSPC